MPEFILNTGVSHRLHKYSSVFNAVYYAYIEAMYFTSTGDLDDPPSDICVALETQFEAMSDCADFLTYCAKRGLIEKYDVSGQSWSQFGHDFWLTRNGHGAGFWDRGIGQLGDELSDAARTFGGKYAYEGDGGLLYTA